MRFSLRRKVDSLSYDEIDKEIEKQHQRAQELLGELSHTLEQQAELWRNSREAKDDQSGS